MTAALIGALAKAAAILLQAPLVTIAIVMAAEYVVSSFALWVAYRRQPEIPDRWQPDRGMSRELLFESWPLVLNSIAIVVSVRVDQMMLTSFMGTTENGIYAAAQRLTEIIYYIPIAVMAAANPVLLRWHQQDAEGYASRLQRVFSALILGGIVIAAGVSLLSGPVVNTLFGSEFARSGPVLAILAWNAPVVFLAVAQSNWFIAHGRQRGLMIRSAVAAVLSVTLNLALIPRLGAPGAAITMVVSQLIAQFFLNAFIPETRELFYMQCRALNPFGKR
jgi:PST family polysaccharide transporter